MELVNSAKADNSHRTLFHPAVTSFLSKAATGHPWQLLKRFQPTSR